MYCTVQFTVTVKYIIHCTVFRYYAVQCTGKVQFSVQVLSCSVCMYYTVQCTDYRYYTVKCKGSILYSVQVLYTVLRTGTMYV